MLISPLKVVKETLGFRWFTEDNQPPVDTPRCGFFNELCVTEPDKGRSYVCLSVHVFVCCRCVCVCVKLYVNHRTVVNMCSYMCMCVGGGGKGGGLCAHFTLTLV